ncbi:MAG TPA: hypothetical protein VGJ44_25510 [Kribbellaceae bacterium]|jgi:hypothetical protein
MRKTFQRFALRGAIVAVLASLLGAFLVQPASAAVYSRGLGCAGTQVKRCLWFNHDSTYNRLRAYAWVADVDGGRNYNVAVNRVHLQVWTSSGWRVVSNSTGTDYDGWHAVRDDAHGPLVPCANGVRFTVRSVAYFQWQGDPSFSGWLAGPAATFTC